MIYVTGKNTLPLFINLILHHTIFSHFKHVEKLEIVKKNCFQALVLFYFFLHDLGDGPISDGGNTLPSFINQQFSQSLIHIKKF